MTNKQIIRNTLLSALLASLMACGSSDDSTGNNTNNNTGNQIPSNEIALDATAGGLGTAASDPANKFTYYDLDAGAVVDITDAEAETNTAWDIAFKRTKTKINGGASGPGSVTAAVANAQEDFYVNGDVEEPDSNVFLNATKESEQADFDAFTDASALSFESDANAPQIDGSLEGDDSWALYDPVDHSISAQPDAWNIVKSADGSTYAKMHVTNIVQVSRDITLEMFIQGDGETAFSGTATTWTANIGAGGGSLCYDLETEAEVDCTTADSTWDIMVEVSASGFEWNIWTNGGIKGSGSDGGSAGTWQTADMTYTGVGDADGQLPDRYIEADAPTGVFVDNSWYAYSLQGAHKLWPNYRVYAVMVDATVYKIQFLSYYDNTGTSGNLTLRIEVL